MQRYIKALYATTVEYSLRVIFVICDVTLILMFFHAHLFIKPVSLHHGSVGISPDGIGSFSKVVNLFGRPWGLQFRGKFYRLFSALKHTLCLYIIRILLPTDMLVNPVTTTHSACRAAGVCGGVRDHRIVRDLTHDASCVVLLLIRRGFDGRSLKKGAQMRIMRQWTCINIKIE